MPHYRKIDVNGETYEYNVGKLYVKVKGFAAISKHKIGSLYERYCECCGEPMSVVTGRDYVPERDGSLRVTPCNIRAFILDQL